MMEARGSESWPDSNYCMTVLVCVPTEDMGQCQSKHRKCLLATKDSCGIKVNYLISLVGDAVFQCEQRHGQQFITFLAGNV